MNYIRETIVLLVSFLSIAFVVQLRELRPQPVMIVAGGELFLSLLISRTRYARIIVLAGFASMIISALLDYFIFNVEPLNQFRTIIVFTILVVIGILWILLSRSEEE